MNKKKLKILLKNPKQMPDDVQIVNNHRVDAVITSKSEFFSYPLWDMFKAEHPAVSTRLLPPIPVSLERDQTQIPPSMVYRSKEVKEAEAKKRRQEKSDQKKEEKKRRQSRGGGGLGSKPPPPEGMGAVSSK